MTKNLLSLETSPYLLLHKDNPVHWRAWGEEALAEARRENKPILLSIGYAACHWCHVMAHESFEDGPIAAVMNEHFVNIKVDREERPDLDVIYQTALGLMGERGGWPLTMFLTPGGEPFWSGTYFPATPKYGHPAFPQILRSIAETFHRQADDIIETAQAIKEAMEQLTRPEGGDGLSPDLLDRTAALCLGAVDPVEGGAMGAPKFPQVPFFTFLWRSSKRQDSKTMAFAVTLTLDRLCRGGIYDHLGGGFSRYSTDEVWLAPHFEKMLYDNALLIELLSEVWQDTRDPLLATRVAETVRWALRDMTVTGPGGEGAFASALDADSEGVEGKYYVWTEAEIDALLGPDSPAFKQAYDVTPGGNWEGKTILNRRGPLAGGMTEDALARCREILLEARGTRVPPALDDKVLCDWNGLMISALVRAAMTFKERAWLEVAKRTFAFVCRHMTEDGRLRHSWRGGAARHAAVLDDYAAMIRAALTLFEATAETAYLDQAEAWTDMAGRRYWDDGGGGYFLSADDTQDVITRPKTISDNAVPSGNSLMAENLVRLFLMTGCELCAHRAEKMFTIFSSPNPAHMTNQSTLLNAYDLYLRGVQIVIVGDPGDPGLREMLDAAHGLTPGLRAIIPVDPGTAVAPEHPAFGKTGRPGEAPMAYVCVERTCGLALTSAEGLCEELARH